MNDLQRQCQFSQLPKQSNQWISLLSDTTNASSKPPVQQQRKFKWSTSLDSTAAKIDLNTAQSISGSDLESLLQSPTTNLQLSAIQRSSSGSQGVYFAQLKQQQQQQQQQQPTPQPGTVVFSIGSPVIVLKPPSHSLWSELLSTLISQQFRVYTPQCHLLPMETEKAVQLMHAIKTVDCSGQAVTALFDQRNLLVKPFCQGLCIDKVPASKDRKQLFHSFLVGKAGDTDRLTEGGAAFFRTIGRLMAIDTLLNNGDRLPLLWDNPGNPGNLFIIQQLDKLTQDSKPSDFMLINLDPQCRPIDPVKYAAEFNDYVRRVKLLLLQQQHTSGDNGKFVSNDLRYRNLQFDRVLHLITQWLGALEFDLDTARSEMIEEYRKVLIDELCDERFIAADCFAKCVDAVGEEITRGLIKHVTTDSSANCLDDLRSSSSSNYLKQELADLTCAWRWLESIRKALIAP